MAHPSIPVANARELIAFARARPGQLTFATAGNGTTGHLAGELFKSMAGVDIVHVPYRGSPQALLDAVAGQVSLAIGPVLTGLPQVKAGKLKGLAVTTPARSASAPEVPHLRIWPAGLRGDAVVRPLRPGCHAARDRRQAERGGGGHTRTSRRARFAADAGCGAGRQQP
jgi:hypothetical protein